MGTLGKKESHEKSSKKDHVRGKEVAHVAELQRGPSMAAKILPEEGENMITRGDGAGPGAQQEYFWRCCWSP